jgi:hypothetical protein
MEADSDALRKSHHALRLQFVSTELDLAITFCQLALATQDSHKAERNTANARRAFTAASRMLDTSPREPKSNPEIDEKLRRLEELFSDLDTSRPKT